MFWKKISLLLLLTGIFLKSPLSLSTLIGNDSIGELQSQEQSESKPLLRVFPSFRKEECDWAIRWDICLNCLKIGRRYAQKIHFYSSGPYREHGCYSEEEGFFLLEE